MKKHSTLNIQHSTLLLLSALQLCSFAAFGQLTVSVTPGYRFNSGEKWSNEKLNLLGAPIVEVAGTVTGSSLAAGGVNAVHITTNALDQVTILGGYDGSATTSLRVNYDTNLTMAVVAGKLGVRTNGLNTVHVEDYSLLLTDLTTNWLDGVSVTTNLLQNVSTNGPGTNTFLLIGDGRNVGTNGGGTNVQFKLTTLNAVQLAAVNSTANTNLINTLASNLLATSFVSTNTNGITAGLINFAHSLGSTPRHLRAVLLCVTNDTPFLAGDEVSLDGIQRTSLSLANYSISANATNIAVRGYALPAIVDGASSHLNINAANTNYWRLKVYAER